MKRPLIAFAAGAALLAAGAAHAGGVNWSVGINLPPVATVISNGPGWVPAPAYYPPTVYAPAPVIYDAPAVVYPDYGYRPARPIVYGPRYVERGYWPRHEWRGPRDSRWVPPGHRGERRHHHDGRW